MSYLWSSESFSKTIVILSAILFPIKTPIVPHVFCIAPFEAVLSADYLA